MGLQEEYSYDGGVDADGADAAALHGSSTQGGSAAAGASSGSMPAGVAAQQHSHAPPQQQPHASGVAGSAATPAAANSAHFAQPQPRPMQMQRPMQPVLVEDDDEDLDPDAMQAEYEMGMQAEDALMDELFGPEGPEEDEEAPHQARRAGAQPQGRAAAHGVPPRQGAAAGQAPAAGRAATAAAAAAGSGGAQAQPASASLGTSLVEDDDWYLDLGAQAAAAKRGRAGPLGAAGRPQADAGLLLPGAEPLAKRARVAGAAAGAGGSGVTGWQDMEAAVAAAAAVPAKPRYKPPQKLVSNVDGECVSVTNTSGQRVYCAVRPYADQFWLGHAHIHFILRW